MPTQLEIANIALAHLAIGRPIGAMNEGTQPARVLSQFYDQARVETLREIPWPFARKFATLTLVAGTADTPATIDYQYSYRYPADCLFARELRVTKRRPDTRDSRKPFVIGRDNTGLLILTDAVKPDGTAPELEYTVSVDEAEWPADFVTPFAFLLAWYAAPSLTGGDPAKLGQRARGAYDWAIERAKDTSWREQEQDHDLEPESAFITERD